jgi:hypothetical protein
MGGESKLMEPTFEESVMRIIQAESDKAKLFVKHKLSLGQLREKIFRRVLFDHLPRKVTISTGVIVHTEWDDKAKAHTDRHSEQIDLLLHDHFDHVPLYQFDDFIVSDLWGAMAGIEVKTFLNKAGFKDMVNKNLSIRNLSREPKADGFGFALDGYDYSKFRAYVSDAITLPSHDHNMASLPVVTCCQLKNYVCVRPSLTNAENERHHAFCVRPRRGLSGWALAVFLRCLRVYVTDEYKYGRDQRLPSGVIYNWYNDLPFDQFEKYHVNNVGEWQPGADHVPPVLFKCP